MNPHYQFQTADKLIAGIGAFTELVSHLQKAVPSVERVLIVTQPFVKKLYFYQVMTSSLEKAGLSYDVVTDIEPEPTEANIENIKERVRHSSYDVLIGLGGGSVLDSTKLLSVLLSNTCTIQDILGTDLVKEPGIPTVLVPTTSGTGSEVTPNAIVTFPDKELKIGIVSRHLLPALVVLDPLLTLSLPQPITAATGMDAFTHSLESFISNKANRFSDMFALESIRLISDGIQTAYHDGSNVEAREKMLIGSTYGGMALTAAGTAAVHAMAYPLGGKFKVTHGVANSMLLPHVMAYNMDAIVDRLAQVAEPMGIPLNQGATAQQKAEAVVQTIKEWTAEFSIPQDLSQFGVREDDLEDLAIAAVQVKRLMDNNPKEMTVNDAIQIYKKLLT
ncbi:iron-containing alcohol dehydrogenase [Bacillus sp. FSL W7-1321]|jgi:alcohol dehydrogenase